MVAVCKHSRNLLPLSNWYDEEWVAGAWQACAVNEYDSLVRRHLVSMPEFTCQEDLYKTLTVILRALGQVAAMSWEQLIASRPNRMKRRYTNARTEEVSKVSGRVKMFVKYELMHDETKAPRAIQHRSSAYTANLARYLIPIEHAFYELELEDNHYFRFAAKGRNALQRGHDLRRMFDHYHEPTIYLADHSKFDSCVSKKHLQLEHRLYTKCNNSRFLKYLLKQQLSNVGFTGGGIKYKCEGRRMSGDANTAIGNTVINYLVLRRMFGPDAIIYVDGDDSVVFMPHRVEPVTDGTGFNTKIEVVRDFHEIEFCQSKPVECSDGWVMCKNPLRAVARASLRCGNQKLDMADYLFTIGVGEGYASSQMPILSALAHRYRQAGGGGKFRLALLPYALKVARWAQHIEAPNDLTRRSFAITFGIDEPLQHWYEAKIMAMVLNHE